LVSLGFLLAQGWEVFIESIQIFAGFALAIWLKVVPFTPKTWFHFVIMAKYNNI
jgi:hypothetical protein